MSEYLVQGSVRLDPGALVNIDDGRDMIVYVWGGSVWVTEEGEPKDTVLSRGQWARLTRPGRAVISAFEASALTLTSTRERDIARGIELVGAPG